MSRSSSSRASAPIAGVGSASGRLGERYRLLLIDNRGVGESDRPPGPYDLDEMAEDVLAVMDEAGWDSAHVMGASMGGVIAQILGVLHPDRVRSLVLACTACRHEPWRRELLAGLAGHRPRRAACARFAERQRQVAGRPPVDPPLLADARTCSAGSP